MQVANFPDRNCKIVNFYREILLFYAIRCRPRRIFSHSFSPKYLQYVNFIM